MTCKNCNHYLHNYRDKYVCTNPESIRYGVNTDAGDSCIWCDGDWISAADELPRAGELVVTYRPDTNGRKVNTERYLHGEWTGWGLYRGPVTYWMHLPPLPED